MRILLVIVISLIISSCSMKFQLYEGSMPDKQQAVEFSQDWFLE